MFRRNVDERLRRIERDWQAQGGGVSDYCRYVNELRRAATLPSADLFAGEAFGSFPAAIHLFAPQQLSDFPRKWLDESFAGWNAGLPGNLEDSYNESRKELAKVCLPSTGILAHILHCIQPYLVRVSPRRCTCGGYERGHSPDCEINIGTGDPAEDLYDVLREWTSDLRGPSRTNLLDMFLEGGAEAVYQGLANDEYDLYQVINIINQRLHPVLHLAMNYSEDAIWDMPKALHPRFTFLLNIIDATSAKPVAGFRATVSEKNECHIVWDTQLRTFTSPAGHSHRTVWAVNLATALIEAIRDIPLLIHNYPVWNWRARD
jgi:hypothetical protein